MKKRQALVGVAVTAGFLSVAAGQAPFSSGNLAVMQIGDGAAALTVGGAPLFVVEMNPSGAVVQSIAVPTTTSGANRGMVVRGTSTSIGHLIRSVDGQYLTFTGIEAPVGGTSPSATPAATNPRIVARMNSQGVIDSSTALEDAYNADDIRAAITTNGTDLWTVGTSGTFSSAGIRYTTLGSTTSIQVSSGPPTNTRMLGIFGGQLYISSSSGSFLGVSTVGTGVPNTSGELITLLPGFPTGGGTAVSSVYDFYFADANTLYCADDRTVANGGGIQKWTYDSFLGMWLLDYTLSTDLGTEGCRGLVGRTTKGVTTLWATTGGSVANPNSVVRVVDNGALSPFTVLATAPANTHYRGIDFVPTGGGPVPCYPNCDGSTGSPLLTANDFQCFLNKYASGDTYANCDGSTGNPLLTANDFQCFLNKYAGGCS
ncbi:MAG: hypothetical protein KF678_06215 [Phycisphaeraceae bacterium]|nr:hypothetical protein [Phycisphaeraceae bacterium]